MHAAAAGLWCCRHMWTHICGIGIDIGAGAQSVREVVHSACEGHDSTVITYGQVCLRCCDNTALSDCG